MKIIALAQKRGDEEIQLPPLVIRTAQDAARGYDHCVEAYWRGEGDGCAFCEALSTYWRTRVPMVEGPPGAISPLGAGGRGLIWRETKGAIVGEVQGGTAGYQIPVGAVLPRPEPVMRPRDGAQVEYSTAC